MADHAEGGGNKLLQFALGLGACLVVIALAIGGIAYLVERYNPDARPAPSGAGRQNQPPPGNVSRPGTGNGPVTTYNGKQWTPTVDCAAMGGTRVINPNTGRPSCRVP